MKFNGQGTDFVFSPPWCNAACRDLAWTLLVEGNVGATNNLMPSSVGCL